MCSTHAVSLSQVRLRKICRYAKLQIYLIKKLTHCTLLHNSLQCEIIEELTECSYKEKCCYMNMISKTKQNPKQNKTKTNKKQNKTKTKHYLLYCKQIKHCYFSLCRHPAGEFCGVQRKQTVSIKIT